MVRPLKAVLKTADVGFNEAAPLRERMVASRGGRRSRPRCFNEAAPLRERMDRELLGAIRDELALQ